ncbi:hypothetical protein FACS1894166_02280 [Bacilli bacterium]|nr:hypothetical protein FACS1894166_02280 [Bacilli bacterium]
MFESSPCIPILVHFHNAPDVKAGGIIDQSGTSITAFNTSSTLSNYDTVYIPADITTITSQIFRNKFMGTGNCGTIQNIIFADRTVNCDTGLDAFSVGQYDSLYLPGDIYIGKGVYKCNGNDYGGFFSGGNIHLGNVTINGTCTSNTKFFSSNDEMIIGNVDIDKDCTVIGPTIKFFSNSGYQTHPMHTIIGNITIKGECKINCNFDYSTFFASFAGSSECVVSIGNILINGACSNINSYSGAHFFSAYGPNAVMETGNITINNDCIDTGVASGSLFFSCFSSGSGNSSLITQNIAINANCTCADQGADR